MNIYVYTFRRFLYVIPLIFGVCAVVFVLFNLLAGDPTVLLLGKHPTAEAIANLRHQLGLDRPLFVQYLDVVKSAFTLDFGRSWSTHQKISSMILSGIGPSLALTLPAFFISSFFAIGISLMVAFYRGKVLDKTVVFFCVVLMSLPSLVHILIGQFYMAYEVGWFEISGYEYGFPAFIPYIILPVIIWIFLSLGPDVRFYRTIMLDEIFQDYVRTARAKGLSEPAILFKHVLKNAMIPIITYIALSLPYLMLGALLLESFFGIPGIGGLILKALNSNDFPVLKAMSVLLSLIIIFITLLVDILYTLVDPRVRLK